MHLSAFPQIIHPILASLLIKCYVYGGISTWMIINLFFPNPAAHELLVDKLFCSTYLWLGLDNDFLRDFKKKKKR